MDRHIIILTTDKRQESLGNLLPGQKIRCSWESYKREEICEKIYILPTPITKLDENPILKEKLKEELITCKGPLIVFAGAINEAWKQFLEQNGIVYWDFMQLPEVVEQNAWITAEATLAEVLNHGQYSVAGQRILVTGYGCCGEKIAKVFAAMGAVVTVAARRQDSRKQVVSDGYHAVSFEEMEKAVQTAHTIINTVPAMVITEKVIQNMRKDALIVDIASKPGGTDFESAQRWGIQARLALGLPGKYTTTSSALALEAAISKYAPLEKDIREDRQWIFQIIM